MSSKTKRARRAKLKAKQTRVTKNDRRRNNNDIETLDIIPPETIAFFKTLPPPIYEEECRRLSENHLWDNGGLDLFEDIEMTVEVLYSLYQEWRNQV